MVNGMSVKLLFSCLVLLLIVERVQNTFANRLSSKSIRVYHKSFFYILLGAYLAIIAIDICSFYLNHKLNLWFVLIGGFIFFLGVMLRRAAINELGCFWSVFVEIKEGQQLIRTGVYKYLRHPYYLAVLLELFGFSLICNAPLGIVLVFALQLPLLLVRICFEEKILNSYYKDGILIL